MEQTKTSSTFLGRITVIDALRGFALLGVILVHMYQHFGIFSFSGAEPEESLFPQLDSALNWFARNILMGKFINIFAFLFGMSFFIQMDSASRKGIDFRKRFIWRMVVLFAIGMAGNIFFTGDILSIYAVFGVFMVLMFKFKNWVLISIAALLLIGTPRISKTIFYSQIRTEQVEQTPRAAAARMTPQRNNAATEKPSFWRSAERNLTDGYMGKLNYQFGTNGRGYLTFALFIIGLIVGRLRFFEQIYTQKRRTKILFAGFTISTILTTIIINHLPEMPRSLVFAPASEMTTLAFVNLALIDITSVLFSGAIVLGFILLYQIKSIGKYLDSLSSYGRMGLTNYVMQGVIGSILFSMWAFGSIFGAYGVTESFILGAVIYALQMVISKYWLKYYQYGPLEWLWRSATYLKIQPLKKK